MKRLTVASALALLPLLAAGCGESNAPTGSTTSSSADSTPTVSVDTSTQAKGRGPENPPPVRRSAGACRLDGELPDPNCTPGAVDPAVTPANVHSTICVRGYTKRVRPPTSYTTPLKRRLILRYGFTDIHLRDYELDHLVALELGGSPTRVRNLFPEPISQARAKDRVEDRLHAEVCSGQLGLRQAQHEIETDWLKAG